MGPTPAVAAVRHAVRGVLVQLPAGSLVLAACSGGADSVSLAALQALAPEAVAAGEGCRTAAHAVETVGKSA